MTEISDQPTKNNKDMNDTFNFRRFGKYFLSDINRLFSENWLKILCFGLIPIFIAVVSLLFSIVLQQKVSLGSEVREAFFGMSAVIFAIWIPSSLYGYVTDKRAGSNYSLIPASTFEKTASMIINGLIIAPAAFVAISVISDMLVTLVSGQGISEAIVCDLPKVEWISGLWSFSYLITILQGHIVMLFFLLGAVLFRKGKISKTILSLMGLSIIFLLLAILGISISAEDGLKAIASWSKEGVTAATIGQSVLEIIVLYVLIYFRLKKIQY